MKFRSYQKVCRLLVMVLFFNIIAPSVFAGSSNQDPSSVGSAVICTSAGLVTISLTGAKLSDSPFTGSQLTDYDLALGLTSDLSNEPGLNEPALGGNYSQSHGEHCPYCHFGDPYSGLETRTPSYLAPESSVAHYYQSLLSTRKAMHVASFKLLRAPPLDIHS